MTRKLVVIAAVLTAAAVGCGGVENEPNLANAVERTEAVGSTRFAAHGTQRGEGHTAGFECDGAGDYARERIRIRCDYANLGELEIVGIAGDVYIRGELFLGPGMGNRWVKETGSDTGDASIFDFSPEKLLAMLRAASSETERVGEEDVRGTSTVRYRLTADCEMAELECKGTAPVEVWIDDDGLVRRIGLEDDSTTATFEFFDFGVEVDIEPPPADQIAEADDLLVPGQGTMVTGDEVECADGEATPISQERAVKTLRRHGFGMIDDGQTCLISNTAGDGSEVLVREGIVHCSVHAEPPADAPKAVERRGADGADAELALENLVCTIFTDSPSGEDKIDKLEAAFEELQRTIQS